MEPDVTRGWSDELLAAIAHASVAHQCHGTSPKASVRFHDGLTPYWVHPLWCAASLLQEATLPLELRRNGAIALLLHDTLEDTTLPLPENTNKDAEFLIQQMSFESFDQEMTQIWNRPAEVRLLKLYDKVSNLLDATWMNDTKWNRYVDYTLRLASDVELYFPLVNVLAMARAIARPRALLP